MQATYFVQGASEFTVVGSDIESYGAQVASFSVFCSLHTRTDARTHARTDAHTHCVPGLGAGNDEAAVVAKNVGDLRLWGMHGRVMAAAAPATDFGVFDIDAKGFLNLNPVLGRVLGQNETAAQAKPEMTLRAGTTTSVQLSGFNYTTTDEGTAGSSELRVVDTDLGGLTIGGLPATAGGAKLTSAQLASFSSLVLPEQREGTAWGRPGMLHLNSRCTLVLTF